MGKWDEEFDKLLAETLAKKTNNGKNIPVSSKYTLTSGNPINYAQTYSHVNPVSITPTTRFTGGGSFGDDKKKKKKWYESGLFEDGYDFGDVAKTLLGIGNEKNEGTDEESGPRDANFWDVTGRSLKRGFYNARYGEESYKDMLGQKNKKDSYEKLLAGDEFDFAPSNIFEKAVSGVFEQGGQWVRQVANPTSLALGGSMAGMAASLGQAGPQILIPEEVISVPGALAAGVGMGTVKSVYEVEAGLAYNEMLESGLTEETSRKVAMGVGGINAALEVVQLDELVDAYKVVSKSDATKNVTKRIAKELAKRGVDVAKETAQEVAQEFVTTSGTQIASKVDTGEWAYSAKDVTKRLLDTAESSALTFGLMNVPAAAKNTFSIVKDQKNTIGPIQNEQVDVDKVVEQEKKTPVPEQVKPEPTVVEQTVPPVETKPKRTLYTGSANTDIKQFKVGGVDGSKQTGDRYGRGIYLTTNENTAKNYAGENGRVYQTNVDDLNIFDLNETITPEMRDSLISAFNGGDKQFRNSMLRNFRTEMTFDDFESAEAFFDKQRKVWKEQDGEYAANKPEIKSADSKTGKAVIEFTDFENWEDNIGTLTGNHLYDALKSLSTDDFSSFITGHGFDGIAFDEDSSNQQYVIYRNEDRIKIDEDVAENATVQQETQLTEENTIPQQSVDYTHEEVSDFLSKLKEEDANDSSEKYQRFIVDGFMIERFRKGDHYAYSAYLPDGSDVTGKTPLDKAAFYADLADKIMKKPKYHTAGSQVVSNPTAATNEVVEQKPLTMKEKAQKHYRDTLIDFDELFSDDNGSNRAKYDAIVKATKDAQDFLSRGSDGVKSIEDIFRKINNDGNVRDFEKYVYHLLNTDRASLDTRFGIANRYVFGENVTAEDSRIEAERLEREHPEFKEALNDVYAFNQHLLNMQVQSGAVSQELANRLNEMYPHYATISRSRWGDKQVSSVLLDFINQNSESIAEDESLDSFIGKVEGNGPLQNITSEGFDFNPLADTMVDHAIRTYWNAALKQVGAEPSIGPIPGSTAVTDAGPSVSNDVQTETSMDQPDNVTMEVEEYVAEPFSERRDDLIREKTKIGQAVAFAQEYIVDNGYEFERVAKKTGNRKLEAMWHHIRNASSIAQNFIGNGDKANGVRALTDIINDVSKSGLTSDFYSYLGHRRNSDGMTMRTRYGIPGNRNFMGRDVTAYDSWSEALRLESKHPEFKKWAQDCYDYTDHFINKFVDRGILSKEDAELWKEIYPHYVPMRTNNGGWQMFESLAQFTIDAERAIAMNDFGLELENSLHTEIGREFVNIDSFISRIDSGDNLFALDKDGKNYTFSAYQNGERVTFDINKEMYMALKPSAEWLNWKIPVLSHASEFFRKATTEYNIWFALKNASRDPQDIIYNSQHPAETYANLAKAEKEVWTKGEWYQEYVANGGNQVEFFDPSDKTFASDHAVKEFVKKWSGLNLVSNVNNRIETAPRLAEYIASREAGKSVAEAMLDAARVTTNFAAGGKFTKFLNRNGCTFLNASVQGALQHSRNWREATMNGFKGWATMAARYVATGLTASLLNKLFWEDDEEYEKLPDYITNNYYLVGKFGDGQFLRLPKGRTNAVIENAIKQVAEMSNGDDGADWDEFWKLMAENLAPNNPLEDNIFAPLIQTATNTTWYGEDIVPYRLKDLPKAEQFDEKTDSLSIWLGEQFDASPKKINYLLNQYTGIIGDTVLPYMTPKAESSIDNPVLKALAPLKDIFTTDSVLNDRVTGDFYDTLEGLEAKAESEDATTEDKFRSSLLNGYNAEISELMKEQREIQTSDIPDSEKYKRNRELKKEINALQKEGLEALNDYRINGVYAEAGNKRFNFGYDTENKVDRWFEIKPKTKDGEDNYFYQQEQRITKDLGISSEEYWNNREMYDDFYYVAGGYDKDSSADDTIETARAVFGYKRFAEYAKELKNIKADKDKNGQPINGTRYKKVQAYIDTLDIPDIEKKILYTMEYPNYKKYKGEIVKYLDQNDDISYQSFYKILDELGYTVGKDGGIIWN